MLNQGVRLQLLVGSSAAVQPAPYEVVSALRDVEVQNNDEQRDGFQLTFTLGRKRKAQDFLLLKGGMLKPSRRLCIVVIIQGRAQVLINGMITRQQVIPSNEPGQSQLRVTGEDTGVQLGLEKRKATYPNQSDSQIVQDILDKYNDLRADVESTSTAPAEVERTPSQHHTDLEYIMLLAERNSFVFFTEPTAQPGISQAYWGSRDRQTVPTQPALSMNMGPATNVEEMSFDFNALEPIEPKLNILDPITKSAIPIPLPDLPLSQLSSQPAEPLRKEPLSDVAKLNPAQAALRLKQKATGSADAVTVSGSLDVLSYGRVLRSRRRVDVRGAGQSNDGTYYVKRVTHRIRQGEYMQRFRLVRQGRGAISETVTL
jgi:hypothetical protein